MSAKRESPDILYLIEARLDSGRSKGAPQLNKDIRVLQKAATEIEQLRGDLMAEIHTNDELRAQLAEAKQRLEKQDAALTMWEEKVKRIQAGLKQPGIVLNNILRGEIVLPESYGRLVELRNRIAELERQPRAVPEFTGEMAAAGMKAWDAQHRTGDRSWPAMLEAVFKAMWQAAQPPPAQAAGGVGLDFSAAKRAALERFRILFPATHEEAFWWGWNRAMSARDAILAQQQPTFSPEALDRINTALEDFKKAHSPEAAQQQARDDAAAAERALGVRYCAQQQPEVGHE